MRAVVFAYHNMGIIGIRRLLDAGFTIELVFSHEDDPAENVWFGSVPELCRELSIPCVCPKDPNLPEWVDSIGAAMPDMIFSFYYRLMLSQRVLDIPPLGAYNLHGSYLPRYRGRCPVNWVIIRGERETGVTLHEMVEKPDAGAVVARKKVAITHDDTALTLFRKLEEASDAMLAGILPRMNTGVFPKVPLDLSKGSYFGGRKPEDGRISWENPAEEIYNLIRGVTRPYPGAFGFLGEARVIFWQATPVDAPSPGSGTIVGKGTDILIGTGRGCLRPVEIEVSGTVLGTDELVRYFTNHKGERFA